MIKNLFLLIVSFTFWVCNDNTLTSEEYFFDEKEALLDSSWFIEKIITKNGTHNPDEIVPLNQMEEINSGGKLIGEINFNPDSTINITNASDEFYFSGFGDMRWSYENKSIRFSHSYGGFGYKVQWFGNNHMRWYIEYIGIESGTKSVKIIEMQANHFTLKRCTNYEENIILFACYYSIWL